MKPDPSGVVIVMADDDDDDILLAKEALIENRVINSFHAVRNGVELMAYLRQEGKFADPPARRPHLVLLDLNMPLMSGLEVLDEMKADPTLRDIPVVVLTTSHADADITRSYAEGAASYIQKPVSFTGMCEVMEAMGRYWFQIVELPNQQV